MKLSSFLNQKWHFFCVSHMAKLNSEMAFSLQFDMNGLPLFKSSSTELWANAVSHRTE
jgi:hypothetical protein